MAKLKLGNLDPGATTRSVGNFLTIFRNGEPYAQKWPRKRGKAKTPYDFYKQTEFGIVAREASSPEPVAYVSAIQLAYGTSNVPRDILMMGAYGTLYKLNFWDGRPVEYYRMVAPNAQLVLDQVTDTVGALLYRAEVGWIEVPPGSNGYFLQMNDLVPEWVHYAPSSAPSSLGSQGGTLDPMTGSTTSFGVTQGCAYVFQAGVELTGVELYCRTAAATCKIAPCVYARNGNVPGALVASGNQVTGLVQGINRFPFSTPYVVPTTDFYFVGASIDTVGFSQPSSNSTVMSWSYPNGFPLDNPAPTSVAGYNATFLKCWPY